MPLIQYACLPTARMEMFYSAMRYPDLAVLDFSMNGHALYNYGSLPWLSEQVVSRQSYSTHMTELDIALGDTGRLRRAAEELREKGFRQAFLMPSSVASVLGLDLKALCEELSGPNFTLFTAPARMDADFFAGSEQLSLALARQFARPEEKAGKSGFCLLGGFFSSASGHDNTYITEAIEGALGIPLAFDNLNPRSILDWRRAATAQVNVVTSQSALKAARFLQERFGVPYFEWFPLGKAAQDAALQGLSALLKKEYVLRTDAVYDAVALQARNVIAFAGKPLACYGDIDRIRLMQALFRELGVQAEYICSHKNAAGLPVSSIDECIARFQAEETVLLSYDSVCEHVPHSVAIDRTGLEYALLTPLRRMRTGVEGAYRVLEKLVDVLLRMMQ